jgi:glutamyl-tRNA synthetase
MHLGNAWSALIAWLDIRKLGGTMVLRMEDLDPDRSRPEYALGIMEDLRWLGLDWDEGPDSGGPCAPYNQSERTDRYEAVFEKLQGQGIAYPCFCSRAQLHSAASAPHAGEVETAYSGRCRLRNELMADPLRAQGRSPAFRISVDAAEIEFADGVYGPQRQTLSETCGDFVIRRSDGVFAYQLAVVVDDAAMGVNRVVRGADLLASTPRQIFLWHLLGMKQPQYVHVPLLIGSDGSRLSKRHASLSLAAMRDEGVRPEAVIGILAAWAGLLDHAEAVRAAELLEYFSIKKLPRESVVVDGTIKFPQTVRSAT